MSIAYQAWKRPDLNDWPTLHDDQDKLNKLLANPKYRKHGIGILLGRGLVAIDIDVLDKALSIRMAEHAVAMIRCESPGGKIIVKCGKAPKLCLLVRSTYDGGKFASSVYTDGQGNRAQVEILTDGQQTVIHAIHPDTHEPYWYLNSDSIADDLESPDPLAPTLLDVERNDLAEVSEELLRQLVDDFNTMAEEAGLKCLSESRTGALKPHANGDDADNLLASDVGRLSAQELRLVLDWINLPHGAGRVPNNLSSG